MQVGPEGLVPDGVAQHAPESRAFYAARGERRGPASLAELREVRAQAPAPRAAAVPIEQVVRGSRRQVRLRIAVPEDAEVRGVHLEIPGGGFYLGPTVGAEERDRALAECLGIAVVGVEHRLAPEDPWPAAPDDCEAAALWLLDHAQDRFGTTDLTIGGTSAGATLAMTTLLRLRDAGRADAVAGAVLQYGTYDLSGRTPAGRLVAGEWFLEAYAGHLPDRTLPDVSPVFGDLRGLPPSLLLVGADDILLEDNLAMAARLSGAGNAVDVRVYPASPHGFTGHPTAMARAALDGRDSWLAGRLAARRPRGSAATQRPAVG